MSQRTPSKPTASPPATAPPCTLPAAVAPRILLDSQSVRLEGIHTGDIVEVDHNGRRFHAIVTGPVPGGLALQPTDRRINYYSCRSREVVGHWAKRGRPRQTSDPLRPSPRQLEIDYLSNDK